MRSYITTCQRCIEGMINIKLRSKGDGTFAVDSNCTEILEDVIITKEPGGQPVDVGQGTKNAICKDAGSYAVEEWKKIYAQPGGLPPPPLGKTICLSFGVSLCFSIVTDHQNNKITATPTNGGYSQTITAVDC